MDKRSGAFDGGRGDVRGRRVSRRAAIGALAGGVVSLAWLRSATAQEMTTAALTDRDATPPSLDELKPQIAQMLQSRTVNDYLEKLKSGAKIEVKEIQVSEAAKPAAEPAKGAKEEKKEEKK